MEIEERGGVWDLAIEGDLGERRVKIVFYVSVPESQKSWRYGG